MQPRGTFQPNIAMQHPEIRAGSGFVEWPFELKRKRQPGEGDVDLLLLCHEAGILTRGSAVKARGWIVFVPATSCFSAGARRAVSEIRSRRAVAPACAR